MEDLTAKFGWYIITIKIDIPKNPGNNLANIFTSMRSLKLQHIKNQAYQYWGTADGNDCPYFLTVWDIDPDKTGNDGPWFFALVCHEMIAKGIQAQISKASFQDLILENKHFE